MKQEAKSINEWAKKIHDNAVKHGWWDEPRTFGDVIALCHSELSEALEAYRNREPLAYCETTRTESGRYGVDNPKVWENGDKPEGVAVEMIDCIIRILDWCRHEGVDVDAVLAAKAAYNKGRPYRHGGKAL